MVQRENIAFMVTNVTLIYINISNGLVIIHILYINIMCTVISNQG